MDALEALHTRVSIPALGEPGPTPDQLQNILRAAARANDHGLMRPWKFLIVEGDARAKLGEVFVQAAREEGVSPEKFADIASKTLRAPMIIIVVAAARPNPKVPDIEQQYSAASAAQLMAVAAHAQGLGSVWRTGDVAYKPRVKELLGLAPADHIVGFLYLGAPKAQKPTPDIDPAAYATRWVG